MKHTIPEFLAMSWEGKGMVLNLGAGKQVIPGAINLDLPDWDGRKGGLPYRRGSIDAIHAHHFLEHLTGEQIVRLLRDCERVLAVGGIMLITVPDAGSVLAAQDVRHVTLFNLKTFRNLLQPSKYFHDEPWLLKVHLSVLMGAELGETCIIVQLVKTGGVE